MNSLRQLSILFGLSLGVVLLMTMSAHATLEPEVVCPAGEGPGNCVAEPAEDGTIKLTAEPLAIVIGCETTLTALVTDSTGDPCSGITVTFTAAGGTFDPSSTATTASNGVASVNVIWASKGGKTINASASSSNGGTFSKDPASDDEVTVVEIESLEWATFGSNTALDANPNSGGGQRIFPGKKTSTDSSAADRKKVTLKVAVSPATEGVDLLIRVWDVDDPSSSTSPVDTNDGAQPTGNDNYPSGDSKTDYAVESTNASGEVEVEFTVSMRPGNNFRAFAAGCSEKRDEITQDVADGDEGDLPEGTARSDMITVWRKLYVEVDAMQADTGATNFVSGTINSATYDANDNETILNIPDIDNDFDKDQHFQPGLVDITGIGTLQIEQFEAGILPGSGEDIYVAGDYSATGNDATGKNFDLYDDDYSNSFGPIALLVTWPRRPDTSRLTPALAPAYVLPIIDITTGTTLVTFQRNLASANDVSTIANLDRQNPATNASEDYWTVYVSSAFQEVASADNDPNSELEVFGSTDEADFSSLIYLEAIRDGKGGGILSNKQEQDTVVHEIGHSLITTSAAQDHGQGGVMDSEQDPNNPAEREFSDVSLEKIRNDAFAD